VRRIFLSIIALSLMGCEPHVQFDAAVAYQADNPIKLKFHIRQEQTATQTPKVMLFHKYNITKQPDAMPQLTPVSDNTYVLQLSTLEAGEYRLVVTVPYANRFAGISLPTQETTAIFDFEVHGNMSMACFSFDKSNSDMQDWSVKGVYVGNRDKPLGNTTCPGLFYVHHSWPYSLNETVAGGSIFIPVSENCFPKPGQQAIQHNQWKISLVSPDLSAKPEWQQLQKRIFRAATRNIPVQISPELQYKIGNLHNSTYLQPQLAPHYPITGGQWSEIKHPVVIPKQAQVTRLILHISGIPEQTVTKEVDSIFVDGICPVQ